MTETGASWQAAPGAATARVPSTWPCTIPAIMSMFIQYLSKQDQNRARRGTEMQSSEMSSGRPFKEGQESIKSSKVNGSTHSKNSSTGSPHMAPIPSGSLCLALTASSHTHPPNPPQMDLGLQKHRAPQTKRWDLAYLSSPRPSLTKAAT